MRITAIQMAVVEVAPTIRGEGTAGTCAAAYAPTAIPIFRTPFTPFRGRFPSGTFCVPLLPSHVQVHSPSADIH